jgi:pimeloyl-ACP methyl ester carboxylesterase
MPSAHPPTSPPVARSSGSKKLGPTTVSDRLDNLPQQHADANADPPQIFGASRNARDPAVGRRTAGTSNLRPLRDMTPSLEFRSIHGYQCAFRVAGSGPAIVLIHGIGGNSSTWNTVQTRLAHRFTVIAPDLLGHGRSDKPRTDYSVAAYANGLRDLLSVLGVDRVSLVGHSLGGGVAMQFAYQFPELVQRLVLVATGGVTRDVSIALRFASLPMVGKALAVLRLPGALPALRLAGRAVQRTAGSTGFGRDLPHALGALAELPEPAASAAFSRTLRAVIDWRGQMITMLDRCYLVEPIPIQLIWGQQDSVIPVRHARLAQAAMPGSRLTIFDRCGHFPFHDDPDRFIEVVECFINSTQPAAYDQELLRRLLRTRLHQHATSGPVAARSLAEDVTDSSGQLRVLGASAEVGSQRQVQMDTAEREPSPTMACP